MHHKAILDVVSIRIPPGPCVLDGWYRYPSAIELGLKRFVKVTFANLAIEERKVRRIAQVLRVIQRIFGIINNQVIGIIRKIVVGIGVVWGEMGGEEEMGREVVGMVVVGGDRGTVSEGVVVGGVLVDEMGS